MDAVLDKLDTAYVFLEAALGPLGPLYASIALMLLMLALAAPIALRRPADGSTACMRTGAIAVSPARARRDQFGNRPACNCATIPASGVWPRSRRIWSRRTRRNSRKSG